MRGQGNIEFLACKDMIISMIEQGYSVKKIYNKLYSEGKISIKYAFFHRILKRNNIQRIKIEPLIKKINITLGDTKQIVTQQKSNNEIKTNPTKIQTLPQSSPQKKKPLFEIVPATDDDL